MKGKAGDRATSVLTNAARMKRRACIRRFYVRPAKNKDLVGNKIGKRKRKSSSRALGREGTWGQKVKLYGFQVLWSQLSTSVRRWRERIWDRRTDRPIYFFIHVNRNMQKRTTRTHLPSWPVKAYKRQFRMFCFCDIVCISKKRNIFIKKMSQNRKAKQESNSWVEQ